MCFCDSSVGIATRLLSGRSGVLGFTFRRGLEFFSLHHCIQNGSGTQPASFPGGTAALSLGVKRPGREADNSSPSIAEFKNAWRLVKRRYNFNFL
jgi:hypothetical protein